MKSTYQKYREKLKEELSIEYKESKVPEKRNFHIHNQLELVFNCSDPMKCRLEHTTVELPSQHLLILNHTDLHYIYVEKESLCRRYVIYFTPQFLNGWSTNATDLLECFYQRTFPDPYILPFYDDELLTVKALLNQLNDAHHQEDSGIYGNDLQTKLLLAQLLLQINRRYRSFHGIEKVRKLKAYTLVYDIYEYIHTHYQEELTIEQITAEFLVSRTQLYTMFQSIAGMTPGEYLIHYRITRAKELLLNGYPVEKTGILVGYQNLSHFSRVFKQQTGISPKKYQLAANRI